jgi:RNA polymerase sigma-70 factor (ECF subfamily)
MNDASDLAFSGADPDKHFERFYVVHLKAIETYVRSRVRDPSAAEDITSEVFAAAYKHRQKFRGGTPAEARAWLLAIAKREVAQHYRRFKDRLQETDLDAAQDDLANLAVALDPAESFYIERFAAALSALTDSQRTILLQRLLLDWDYETIADHHEISEQAARSSVYRSLRTLSTRLAHEAPRSD